MSEMKYKRILLKLSGEALAGSSGFGIDVSEAEAIASRIKEVHEKGVEVAVVIGAGNIWRGEFRNRKKSGELCTHEACVPDSNHTQSVGE